jgi:hypothetical protein
LLYQCDGAGEAELGDLAGKSVCIDLWRAVEVIGSEVFLDGAIAQHVGDRGEHGRGHGADRLLGSSSVSQPLELRLIIGALGSHRSPGALDWHGLQQRRAVA